MKSLTTAVAAACALFAMNVFAVGYTQTVPVEITIDVDNGIYYAQGDMATARYYSEGGVAVIGCGVKHWDGYTLGFCQATDEDDQRAVCFTENPDILEAVSAINDYSFIQFSWTPSVDPETGDLILNEGDCTRIGVSSQSFYLPDDKDAILPKK